METDDARREIRDEEIGRVLDALGYDLVRARLSAGQGPTLQVMAERRDRKPMTVEHCAEISRALSAAFEAADPVGGEYTLEVSSPGIDRPLVAERDFVRFAGFEARFRRRRRNGTEREVREKAGSDGEAPGRDGPDGESRAEVGTGAGIEAGTRAGRRRRFRGVVLGCRDGVVAVDTEEGEVSLPLAEIEEARLVVTDQLLAATGENNEETGETS